MVGMDLHCQIVAQSLAGERPVDEQTGVSTAVLADRLERLKQSSPLFAGVMLSPYVQKMQRHVEAVVAG
ncbi:MAG TPA: hypothetical protein PLT20_11880 [Sedimentisphaerales bacterium]|nr:hypothetical protein [Sedimentisphaerales bacterium]HQI28775.1 hypothetical protein [Sedimentisphaerales bacterium]